MSKFTPASKRNQISVELIVWVLAFATVVCVPGIIYAMLKNQHVNIAREIENIDKEIIVCEQTTEYYESKTASITNRWAIRERLGQDKSNLQIINPDNVEYIQVDSPTRVASHHR